MSSAVQTPTRHEESSRRGSGTDLPLPAPSKPAGLFAQTTAILGKDLLLEWRGRSRVIAVLMFGIVTLMLFSFAVGPEGTTLRLAAGGFLVLALLLSSTLALSESFRVEQAQRSLEGLLLLPVDPVALYYGKALGNALFLTLLGPILTPVAVVLYSLDLSVPALLSLWFLWGLAAFGLSAPGTLYAAMTSRLESQDVLLPLLLFPLVIPVLLSSVKAASLIVNGDPMSQLPSWSVLLLSFNVIYWVLCGILFPYVYEEGV